MIGVAPPCAGGATLRTPNCSTRVHERQARERADGHLERQCEGGNFGCYAWLDQARSPKVVFFFACPPFGRSANTTRIASSATIVSATPRINQGDLTRTSTRIEGRTLILTSDASCSSGSQKSRPLLAPRSGRYRRVAVCTRDSSDSGHRLNLFRPAAACGSAPPRRSTPESRRRLSAPRSPWSPTPGVPPAAPRVPCASPGSTR